ncbi:MAG: hypothetical protein ACFFB1_12435 [Promethearchaeota archaeon]
MIQSTERIIIITKHSYDIDNDTEFYNPLPDCVPNLGISYEPEEG